MTGLRVIPYNTTIDFVKLKYISYLTAALLILASLFAILYKGFNLGIDFKGGISIEIRTNGNTSIAELRSCINSLKLGDAKLQEFGSKTDFLIRLEEQQGGELQNNIAITKIKEIFKKKFGNSIEYRKIETVGAKVSDNLVTNGISAVCFAMIGMLLYIWNRFKWEYGLCGVIALLHDTIVVLGFYAVSGFEFNESAFAAILTTVGYSINDTVVVYDRLRENLAKYKEKKVSDLINLSINETLSRTILTSGTTLLALCALYFYGGAVIENFSMPIIIGIMAGTFSSIFLSMNLLLFFDLKKKKDTTPVAHGPVKRT